MEVGNNRRLIASEVIAKRHVFVPCLQLKEQNSSFCAPASSDSRHILASRHLSSDVFTLAENWPETRSSVRSGSGRKPSPNLTVPDYRRDSPAGNDIITARKSSSNNLSHIWTGAWTPGLGSNAGCSYTTRLHASTPPPPITPHASHRLSRLTARIASPIPPSRTRMHPPHSPPRTYTSSPSTGTPDLRPVSSSGSDSRKEEGPNLTGEVGIGDWPDCGRYRSHTSHPVGRVQGSYLPLPPLLPVRAFAVAAAHKYSQFQRHLKEDEGGDSSFCSTTDTFLLILTLEATHRWDSIARKQHFHSKRCLHFWSAATTPLSKPMQIQFQKLWATFTLNITQDGSCPRGNLGRTPIGTRHNLGYNIVAYFSARVE
ncbi:hypothetical protein B0H11DRAFT_2212833 [Mycena galericulata]|nr:hypothetical protein B0H11DRAFT_2212833 [Mycena galericulata]